MRFGPHLCAAFKRLVSERKRCKHLGSCGTCREFLRVEQRRRLVEQANAQLLEVGMPAIVEEGEVGQGS